MVYCSERCFIEPMSPMLNWQRYVPVTVTLVTTCKQSPADHAHMSWTCLRLTNFWSDIFQTFKQAFNTNLEPNPLTALFGLPQTKNLPSTTQRVMAFTILLARVIILLKWKYVSSLSHNSWLCEILQCLQLEKLRFSQKGSLTAFHKTGDLMA